MADLRRDDNDFMVVNGDFEIIDDRDEVLQRVIERLRSFAGEWFLDDEGLPYFTEIFGKNVNLRAVHALTLNTVLSTPGVASVREFNVLVDTETRQFQVTATVDSTRGRFGVSGFFGGGPDVVPETPITPPTPTIPASALRDLSNDPITDLSGDYIQDLS